MKKVILELVKGDKVFELPGVLKDYTSEFIELMDVDYTIDQDDAPRKADVVVLRSCGIVRHLGFNCFVQSIKNNSLFKYFTFSCTVPISLV